jgi:CRP-like cAMP-binding protein
MSNIAQVLKGVDMFSGLNETMLDMVAANCTPIRRKKGEIIVHQNEPGSTMYVIIRGRVKVTRTNEHFEEIYLAERGPHDCFGEMSLLDGSPRFADVTAVTDCELIVLEREPFIRLLRDSPEVALKIMATLIRRIRETDQKVISRAPVRARLAQELDQLADQYGRESRRGIRIESGMSKTELAVRITAAREVVSRTLSMMRQEGLVEFDGRVIVVLNREKLKRDAKL